MSADVEKMFSVREMPWHRQGEVLDDYPQSFAEARVLAGLDWDPVPYPVAHEVTMTEGEFKANARRVLREGYDVPELLDHLGALWKESLAPRVQPSPPGQPHGDSIEGLLSAAVTGDGSIAGDKWFRIARNDTGATLSYQRDSYTVIPNSAFGEIIDSVIGAEPGKVKLETGGCLSGGRKVWMLARLDEPHQVACKGRIDQSVSFPYLGVTSSHDGQASCAARLTEVRIVCHAEGTPIIDGSWRGEVQAHASATRPRTCKGKLVTVWGLPFAEKVTPEHRYWARARKSLRSRLIDVTSAQWVYARDLKPGYHEIGLPVDMTEQPAPEVSLHAYAGREWTVSQGRDPRLDDPEWWWLLGYWWGNGTLHHGRNGRRSGFSLSVPDSRPGDLKRIVTLLRSAGWKGQPIQREGCKDVVFTDATLGHFLSTWYGYPGKVPPVWAEYLPLSLQRQLVRGYWDADGDHKTLDGAIITSIGLDGLLALRRILLRLGIPSSIRKGVTAPDGTMQIQGRTVNVRQSYTIRFWWGIGQLGLSHRFKGRYSLPYVEDGMLWSRVKSVTDTGEDKFWPITTATSDYLTAFGRSHNCANTFAAAEAEGQRTGAVYSFSHRGNWRDRLGEAREALQFAREENARYIEVMSDLLGISVTPHQEHMFLRAFIPAPPDGLVSERVARNIDEARAAVLGFMNGPTVEGAGIRGTAYGLVQAAGEYLDHVRASRSWEGKLNRSLLRPEPLKAKAAVLAREAALA